MPRVKYVQCVECVCSPYLSDPLIIVFISVIVIWFGEQHRYIDGMKWYLGLYFGEFLATICSDEPLMELFLILYEAEKQTIDCVLN